MSQRFSRRYETEEVMNMDFNLESMWDQMGLVAKGVAVVLLAMGVATLTVTLERLIFLWRSRRHSRLFARELGALLERGEHERAANRAAELSASPLASLVAIGLRTYTDARRTRSAVAPVEMARRELGRKLETLGASLRRGLGVLASVGSVAPFVGLFGTVVGIISAFQGIAETGSGGISSVAGGIAEALVVTGLGLAIAVPAVLAFNALSSRFDALELALQNAAGELVDHLESGKAGDASIAPYVSPLAVVAADVGSPENDRAYATAGAE
jgi:biopolymer transport protein ExbB